MYAQQPEGNLCLVFEQGGSDLIAGADLDVDQDIPEFVVVDRPGPIEIPWMFSVKHVKSLKKRKKAGLEIVLSCES